MTERVSKRVRLVDLARELEFWPAMLSRLVNNHAPWKRGRRVVRSRSNWTNDLSARVASQIREFNDNYQLQQHVLEKFGVRSYTLTNRVNALLRLHNDHPVIGLLNGKISAPKKRGGYTFYRRADAPKIRQVLKEFHPLSSYVSQGNRETLAYQLRGRQWKAPWFRASQNKGASAIYVHRSFADELDAAGKLLSVKEAAVELGIGYDAFRQGLSRGLSHTLIGCRRHFDPKVIARVKASREARSSRRHKVA